MTKKKKADDYEFTQQTILKGKRKITSFKKAFFC
jgi:hypothetical protein